MRLSKYNDGDNVCEEEVNTGGSDVHEALARIQGSLKHLESTQSKLGTRLALVLNDNDIGANGGTSNEDQKSSPLVNELRQINDRIVSSEEFLRSLLLRLTC